MFHSIGEEAVAMMTMLAQLKSMKVGKDGKSIYDHYNVVESADANGVITHTVEWDGTVRGAFKKSDGTIEDLKGLTSNEITRLYYVYESLHGGYRQDEKVKLEYYLLGEVFMQFKRYLPGILKNVMRSRTEVQQ